MALVSHKIFLILSVLFYLDLTPYYLQKLLYNLVKKYVDYDHWYLQFRQFISNNLLV